MPIVTKQYISRNGQIEYEIDEAGEILTYGRDALGNVVAGYDKNTNAVFTIDYKPFGEFAATTGTITGRRFLWVGTWGYRFTSGVPVSHYIRARHLMMRMGMWITVDPLWPEEMAYGYVEGNVESSFDPGGNRARKRSLPPKVERRICKTRLSDCLAECAAKGKVVKTCVEARTGKQAWVKTVCTCMDAPGWNQIVKRIGKRLILIEGVTNALCAAWYMDCINAIWDKNWENIDIPLCACHDALEESISNSNGIQQCAADLACGSVRFAVGMYCSDYYKAQRGR